MSREETKRLKIRRENLEAAIKIAGSAAKLSRKTGISASEISQMRNIEHQRNVGDLAAEKIEEALELSHGWMDARHPEFLAEKSILEAGFDVTKTPEQVASINWKRWSTPDLIVTKKGRNLSVYVEIIPLKRFGIPMSPTNTKTFVFIREDRVDQAGDILTEHFEKYAKGELPEDEPSLQPTTNPDISALMPLASPNTHRVLEKIQTALDEGKMTEDDLAALEAIADRLMKSKEE